MALRISFAVLSIALVLVGTSAFYGDHEQHTVSFGYNGNTGPGNWGSLSPLYETCSHGKWQSPVDIVKEKVVRNKSLKPLIRDYGPANATLINHGFNIAITFDEHVGVLVADGKNFTLMHVHWHSPSEHRIEGEQFPVELHLVHKAADGNFSVVSTLYRYGDPDPFLYKLKDKLDELAKESCAADEEAHIPLGILQTKYMRRNTRKYYRYFGSLTTPPCTEHIMWNILGKVRSISKDQVEALRAPLWSTCKNNSRPIQPLSGRHIELYDDLGNN